MKIAWRKKLTKVDFTSAIIQGLLFVFLSTILGPKEKLVSSFESGVKLFIAFTFKILLVKWLFGNMLAHLNKKNK